VFQVDDDDQRGVVCEMRAQRRCILVVFRGAAETGRAAGITVGDELERLLQTACDLGASRRGHHPRRMRQRLHSLRI